MTDHAQRPHHFAPGIRPPSLLLLHGTGGTERDLLPLAGRIAPEAPVLSPRGTVLEHGMARYFHRKAIGVFDLEDLHRRTTEMAGFLQWAEGTYEAPADQWVALGYSNGANMAASLLLSGIPLAGAILLRPMVPFRPRELPRLGGMPVLILSSNQDPYVPGELAIELANLLEKAGAIVERFAVPTGHGLGPDDTEVPRDWLRRHFPAL
ncbi:MAG: alpha/beta hydrolase [Puniceicoccaceae bacterium]|nr:MAG: alpha/beta hydrolase [Puniceicoccaceae bacterium]